MLGRINYEQVLLYLKVSKLIHHEPLILIRFALQFYYFHN